MMAAPTGFAGKEVHVLANAAQMWVIVFCNERDAKLAGVVENGFEVRERRKVELIAAGASRERRTIQERH
jgi:hypothetical protein